MEKHTVLNGTDRFDEYKHLFQNGAVGLITNPTGINKALVSTADVLHSAGVLSCLLSPEHGVRGSLQAGEKVQNYVDQKTGIPVYSLYGNGHSIPREVMEKVDIIAFDIQDIGSRYYTYIHTLSYAMEDCAAYGKTMVVFDRVNPISGNAPEGNLLDKEFSSFVGRYPVATRHNLTVGEYASYINDTFGIGCKLVVIPLKNWKRETYFDQTDLIWVPPSPNMPSLNTALCYVGSCLFEGTNLSEGRGTANPFECIGAPWLDGEKIAAEFNGLSLDGVKLRQCYFTPTFSKYANTVCNGVYLHVTDRNGFRPFAAALYLLDIIRKSHSEFQFAPVYNGKSFIDLLFGSDIIRSESFSTEEYLKECEIKMSEYRKSVQPFYLY